MAKFVRKGRPPEFSWCGATTVALVAMQRGSLRAVERYLPPARSTILRWRERPAFRILLAFALAVPKLRRKAKQAGPAWVAAEFRDAGLAHCEVVFHVMRRVLEAGEDSKTPAFDHEITGYLTRAAECWHIK